MLRHAQDYPPDTRHSADICIVGAGAAGITLAHKLLKLRTGKRILLLESADFDQTVAATATHPEILRHFGTYPPNADRESGLRPVHRAFDPLAQQLNGGVLSSEMERINRFFLTDTRVRAYGGTTNCWGGWTRPLNRIDFHRTELGANWPISRETLHPRYYDEAMQYCSLPAIGVDRYDQEHFWLRTVPNIEFINMRAAGGKLVNACFMMLNASRLDFQTIWGPDLAAADAGECTVLRNANVRHVSGRGAVESLFGSTIENGKHGRDFTVTAEHYVLATGGIEVARLLLASAAAGGLDAGNDNLGRFFQVHPLNTRYGSYKAGRRRPSQGMINLYEREPSIPIGDHPAAMFASLAPSDETLADLKLRNFRARISFPGAGLGVVNLNWEQAPNPDSRVRLSAKTDPFWGDPLSELDWKTQPIDKETPATALMLIAETMAALGYGRDFSAASDTIEGLGDHHMGTARMAASAAEGYVDADCRVFGAGNLFIASSAVFPTSGYANPTLTIIALAARLADHLADRQP